MRKWYYPGIGLVVLHKNTNKITEDMCKISTKGCNNTKYLVKYQKRIELTIQLKEDTVI